MFGCLGLTCDGVNPFFVYFCSVRERITINRPTYSLSSSGVAEASTTEVGTFYAQSKKLTDDQDMIGSYNTVEDIWEFKIRVQKNITFTTKDLVVWEGKEYQVIGISDQSSYKRFIKLKCSFINPDV